MLSKVPVDLSKRKGSRTVNFDLQSQHVPLVSNEQFLTRTKGAVKMGKRGKYLRKPFGGKYFSNRESKATRRDLMSEPSPFIYPKDLEQFSHQVMNKAWRESQRVEELKFKYNQRQNNRTRNQSDLLSRLYVKEAGIKTFKTIQDIDPEFYSLVEGRAIGDKVKLKEYINNVRDVLKTKIVTGYREDDILLIEENIILEQKVIDDVRSDYQAYATGFEEFLYNDHTNSMKLLKELDQKTMLSSEKYAEYRALSKEYGALRSIMHSTEEKWRNCKLYQKFLYFVSPMSWRREHDYYFKNKEESLKIQESEDFFTDKVAGVEEASSLEDLINRFHDDCKIQEEPLLYFTEPDQLLEVFRYIELQNLNSLLYAEELAIPLENVKKGMINAEQLFSQEINTLQGMIDKLSLEIEWEEKRADYLEELAKELVNKEFRSVITDEDYLTLQVLVEDVYETRIGPNNANLSMEELMKGIEKKFLDELLKLDKLPSVLVTKIETETYQEEVTTLKIAEKAARDLSEFEQLFDRLIKVFSPPYYRTQKELKWRSPPVNPPRPIPPPPRSLTEKEKIYLEFFTNYCKYTDDIKDYGIDINQDDRDQDNIEDLLNREALEEKNRKIDKNK